MARCGIKTEVYSRVVGYHRPIRNWNKGKQEEFKDRREFSVPRGEKKDDDRSSNTAGGSVPSRT